MIMAVPPGRLPPYQETRVLTATTCTHGMHPPGRVAGSGGGLLFLLVGWDSGSPDAWSP